MTDPDQIRNWQRLDDRITTSGQPVEHELMALRDLGVEFVINLALHTHADALPDEAGSVAALGMTYIHIPVDFERPTEADFDRFRASMAEVGGRRVHVHCILNARVSAFLYRYRRDVAGLDEGEARAAMEKVWRPGGVWAKFVGDNDSIPLPHRGPGET